MPTFFWVVYLRSSVLAGRCLPAVLTSTCGAIASTAGVDLSLPPVAPADVPALFRPRIGTFTSGGAEMFMPDGMGCIPPVVSPTLGGSKFEYTSGGSCGRACNTRPRIGTSTCGATLTTTCGAITSAVGVHLSIPPVAPADVPALFHPRIRTFTCGATDIYLRC